MIPVMIEVPYSQGSGHVILAPDIVRYCDETTHDAERDDLRWLDCAWMHQGYYGTPKHIMQGVRDEYFNNPLPPLPEYPLYPVFDPPFDDDFPCEYGCHNDGLTEEVEAHLDEVWPVTIQEGSMDPFIPTDKLHLELGEEEPL